MMDLRPRPRPIADYAKLAEEPAPATPDRKTDAPVTQPPPERRSDPFEKPDKKQKPCVTPGPCPLTEP